MKVSVEAKIQIELASDLPRVLVLNVVSTGCLIVDETGELLYAGSGSVRLKIRTASRFITVDAGDGAATVDIPELRTSEAGWTLEPSMTDLDPKPMGAISPEIQAVMDHMNRNAIIREQAMLRALGKRE